MRAMYLGDEAIVDTRTFSLEGRAIRKVRQSVHRLEAAGYRVEAIDVDELDDRTLEEIEDVSARWRDGAAERGFSMAMDSLRGGHQAGSVVVAARDADGVMRGFIHFVPSYGRPAMSLSLMRRDRETPNGLMEFLVVRAIDALKERGVAEISLNFAAFGRWLERPRGPGRAAARPGNRRSPTRSSRSRACIASTPSSRRAGSLGTWSTSIAARWLRGSVSRR